MRRRFFVLFYLVIAAVSARADESFPTLKAGGNTYSNVTVTTVTATDIYFKSDQGRTNAKLSALDPTMQKHFHYDSTPRISPEQALASAMAPFDPVIDSTNAQSVMDDALRRVKAIVNQPVHKFARAANMDVGIFRPGWFHPGANIPDYNNVDIRTTVESPYAQNRYVTSDLNPGVVFLGAELEFNANTKYFYIDRTLPKKKLTEAEMVQINHLYRIIGKCESTLHPVVTDETVTNLVTAETDAVPNPPMFSRDYLSLHKKQLLMFGVGLLVVAIALQLIFKKRA
jgi:hypothetical protein